MVKWIFQSWSWWSRFFNFSSQRSRYGVIDTSFDLISWIWNCTQKYWWFIWWNVTGARGWQLNMGLMMDLYLDCYSDNMLDLNMISKMDLYLEYWLNLKFDSKMVLDMELYRDWYLDLNMGSNMYLYLNCDVTWI